MEINRKYNNMIMSQDTEVSNEPATTGFGALGETTPSMPDNQPAAPGFGAVGEVTPSLPSEDETVSPGFGPEGDVMPFLPSEDETVAPGFGPEGDVMPSLPSNNRPTTPGFRPVRPVTPSLPSNNRPILPGTNVSVSVIPIVSGASSLAYIRFLNAATNGEPVDIYVNNKLVVSRLEYGGYTGYFRSLPGTYRVVVYRSNNRNTPLVNTNLTFSGNMVYTAAIIGTPAFNSIQLVESRTRYLSDNVSYLRFANFSPNAPALDVYIDGRLIISDVTYKEVSNYISLIPGTHIIILKIAGTNIIVFDEPQVQLKSGQSYTAFILGDYKLQLQVLVVSETI